MGYMLKTMLQSLDNGESAQSVNAFADKYAPSTFDQTKFINTFKNIGASAPLKIKWASDANEQNRIKANLIGVLGTQFKFLKKDHMPQLKSMSLLGSLNGFCQAGCDKTKVKRFLDLWEKAAKEKEQWRAEDTVEFANCVRDLRQDIESALDKNSTADMRQAQKLQAHLCYIEAGFYMSSRIQLEDGHYGMGPREGDPINSIQEGVYGYEQPLKSSEKGFEEKARELAHDVLISHLFDQEASFFTQLGLVPRMEVRSKSFASVDDLKSRRSTDKVYQQHESNFVEMFSRADGKLRQLRGVEPRPSEAMAVEPISTGGEESKHREDHESHKSTGGGGRRRSKVAPVEMETFEISSEVKEKKGWGWRIADFLSALREGGRRVQSFVGNAAASVLTFEHSPLEMPYDEYDDDSHHRSQIEKMNDEIDHLDAGVKRWMHVIKDSKRLKAMQLKSGGAVPDIDEAIAGQNQSRKDQRDLIKRGLNKYLEKEEALLKSSDKLLDANMLRRVSDINRNIDHALNVMNKQSRFLMLQKAKHYVMGTQSKKQALKDKLNVLVKITTTKQKKAIKGMACHLFEKLQSTSESAPAEDHKDWREEEHEFDAVNDEAVLKEKMNAFTDWLDQTYGLDQCDSVDGINRAVQALQTLAKNLSDNDVEAAMTEEVKSEKMPKNVTELQHYLQKQAPLDSGSERGLQPSGKK